MPQAQVVFVSGFLVAMCAVLESRAVVPNQVASFQQSCLEVEHVRFAVNDNALCSKCRSGLTCF